MLLILTACADNGSSLKAPAAEGQIEGFTSSAPDAPLAKLFVGLRDSIGDLTVVALDATDSKYDPAGTQYKFSVREKMAKRTVLLAGPGQILKNYVTVLLPAGTYEVMLTVMNSKSEVASVIETITVQGSTVQDWRPTKVEWSLDAYYQAGGATEIYSRAPGRVTLGVFHSLYESNTSLGSSGAGCGGLLTNGGNGLAMVSGVFGYGVTIAAPELKVAKIGVKDSLAVADEVATSAKTAGGSKSGACLQSQIDEINDQLAYQEAQIQTLFARIARDEQVFFKEISDLSNESLNAALNNLEKIFSKFSAALPLFMTDAALWDPGSLQPWVTKENAVLELDLLKIAASLSSDPSCTVGLGDCSLVTENGGPLENMHANWGPLFSPEDIQKVAGAVGLDNATCTYDCWKHVGRAQGATNELLAVFADAARRLDAQVDLCTSTGPVLRNQCYDPENNIVPLMDQYNTFIVAKYLEAANALQKSHSMQQLTNLYNYNRFVASQCSNEALTGDLTQSCIDLRNDTVAGTIAPVLIDQIFPAKIRGTLYKFQGTICGRPGEIAQSPEQNKEAFGCAQQQLGMAYAQLFDVLYSQTLSFIITDGPVGAQAYPSTAVVFPPNMQGAFELNQELQRFNQNLSGVATETDPSIPLGAIFDYADEIGSALPDVMKGARTPMDLVRRVAGFQGPFNGSLWTKDSVLYQSYHISDGATCIQTLLNYNGSGLPDTAVENVFPNFDSCPSIFALHDNASVINGFYDGITLQPYSFAVSPGGADPCPSACSTCGTGLDLNDPNFSWIPGGQGLFTDDQGAAQCRGFCSSSTNTCGDYDFADDGATDCTQCSSAPNVKVLALSAPMGGNVRRCKAVKVNAVLRGALENETLDCSTSVYYGKQYLDSLADGAMPGSGPEATFEDLLAAGEYSVWPHHPALDWNVEGGANGSALPDVMKGSLGSCENPTFSGYAGNPSSPPTLEASCKRSDGTKNVSKATCESGHWGNAEGQLFCEASPGLNTQAYTSATCASSVLGDPASGYNKQCFCPNGNQLGWLRPETTSDPALLAPGLTYLSCGDHAKGNRPRVRQEYAKKEGTWQGALYSDSDHFPPGYLKDVKTAAQPGTRESDIGLENMESGIGVNYEVSFANISTDCNTQDNIQLDIYTSGRGFAAVACENPEFEKGDHALANTNDLISEKTKSPSNPFGSCLQFEDADRISNAANEKSNFFRVDINTTNRLGDFPGINGPSIPIELVMQCSDNVTSQYGDCVDQSTCMHMVSIKDPVDTLEQQAEAMAKRGYICKNVISRPEAPLSKNASNGGNFNNQNYAIMECQLADGRTMTLKLAGYNNSSDRRARVLVTID